jgi:predicted nuclease of predicted toxin-antitoxin system
LANELGAVLMTEDTEFGELVFRLKQVSHGVVLIRLSGVPSEEKGEIVAHLVSKHEEEMLNSFSVINQRKIRIRRIEK